MHKNLYINILIMFGIGNIKYAPGTIASFITCMFYCYLFSQKAGIFLILFFYIFLTISSINLIDKFSNKFKKKDPREIVIDEFIGQSVPLLFFYMVTSLGLPVTLSTNLGHVASNGLSNKSGG